MIRTLAFLVLAGAVLGYGQDASNGGAGAPGCGPAKQKFEVTASKTSPTPPALDSAKATIYVIQDDGDFDSTPKPITRIGVDGQWIGATRTDSYLRASVDPGEHHLCSSWQNFVGFGMGMKTAALHFTAEAGKTYYFRVRDKWRLEHGHGRVELETVDSDQGQLMATRSSYSVSKLKQ